MFDLLSLFGAGLVISFLGSLPLGTLNMAAMQIGIQESTRRALVFALGVAIVELIYVRLSLKGVGWIMANQKVFYWMEWATVVLFLVLGISSMLAARRKVENGKNLLLNNSLNRFWLGITMSAVNPVQIPFWFMWSSYLYSVKLLRPEALLFNIYTAGIGLGTISGLLLFIFGGRWLVQRLNTGQRTLNFLVGLVFIISSLVQLFRILGKTV